MRVVLRVGLTGGIGAGKSDRLRARWPRSAPSSSTPTCWPARSSSRARRGSPRSSSEFGTACCARRHAGPAGLGPSGVRRRRRSRQRLNAHPAPADRRAHGRAFAAAAPPDAVVVHDVRCSSRTAWRRLPARARRHRAGGGAGAPAGRRPGDDRAEARARMAAQADDERRAAVADVLLDNGGPPDAPRRGRRLWHERLVPFEANLRHRPLRVRRGRARRRRPDVAATGRAVIARSAGPRRPALRVDHIGSTSVPASSRRTSSTSRWSWPTSTPRRGRRRPARRRAGAAEGEWWDSARTVARCSRPWPERRPGAGRQLPRAAGESPAWREVLTLRDRLRADRRRAAYVAAQAAAGRRAARLDRRLR